MLQVDSAVSKKAPLSQPAAVARAENLKRVAWLHIRKTGGNVLNTLIHNPTLCPHTPADLFVPEDDKSDPNTGPLMRFLPDFDVEANCPDAWSTTYGLKIEIQHAPIASVYADNVGHWVTMLRQPEQRLISAWNQIVYSMDIPTFSTLKEFVMAHQGQVVNLLTFEYDPADYHGQFQVGPSPPTKEQDALAVKRLREGFAFVGLTEEWELSICLFHAMFGGACVREEFKDTHMGTNRTTHEPYDTTMLEGFVDVHDALVYEEGVRIFESNIQQYRVSRSKCPSACM